MTHFPSSWPVLAFLTARLPAGLFVGTRAPPNLLFLSPGISAQGGTQAFRTLSPGPLPPLHGAVEGLGPVPYAPTLATALGWGRGGLASERAGTWGC